MSGITFNVIAICVLNDYGQEVFREEYERRKDMRSLGNKNLDLRIFSKPLS
jgi:hypothetical protein